MRPARRQFCKIFSHEKGLPIFGRPFSCPCTLCEMGFVPGNVNSRSPADNLRNPTAIRLAGYYTECKLICSKNRVIFGRTEQFVPHGG